MRIPVFALLAMLSVGGCSGTDAPTANPAPAGATRELGVIAGVYSADPLVELSVQGHTVHVAVTTWGNGCYVPASTDVTVVSMDAVVSPYDWNPRCAQRDLRGMVHTARIPFAGAGLARIHVRGIDASRRSSSNMVGDTVTILRTIRIP